MYNNFYGVQYDSSLTFLFNEEFNSVKGFKTINYTGSKSRENVYSIDSPSYTGIDYSIAQIEAIKSSGGPNPTSVDVNPGWWVYNAETNLEKGSIPEFINKEGKYFNYIKGENTTLYNISTEDFSVQGIGRASSIESEGVSVFNVRVFADPSCFSAPPLTAFPLTNVSVARVKGSIHQEAYACGYISGNTAYY